MTLHWWMHWFWVTALLTLHASSARAAAVPQSEELQHITTDTETDHRPSDRQGRAMYFSKSIATTPRPVLNVTEPENKEEIDILANATTPNTTEIVHPSIQWTAVNTSENDTSIEQNAYNSTNVTNVTVLPVNTNLTETQNATVVKKKNLTRPDFVKDETSIQEGVSESRIVTEKPLSLETTFLQTRIPPNIELYRRVADTGDGGMDTGAIAGISFAALVLAALAGSTAFVLYRRRYLNKPQTLNDKCSNPDSSGYLDDSTIRDNSEEMYSLDNDSFLNSLEAMTIQNYWTDTVKHTKL
ncbi:uncharacterized protein LOC126378774 [Pectinophora gossypiella]|uniref:uncharacterized protein LOC126378774 n=1 Tax=Pectinophora gossypiella TaxID=13191 RepID=UPI00214F39AC|nr:uncharacterized protein LOC126378774 [Pectinophora gossypiella]XP_049883130.1 uncharacterized protein LOC126378774 [Pectinophora gossypiella]